MLDRLFHCLHPRIRCLFLHSSTKSSNMIVNQWMTQQPEICGVCCVLTNRSLSKASAGATRGKPLLEASELLRTKQELVVTVIRDFSAVAASKLFDQEIREAAFLMDMKDKR